MFKKKIKRLFNSKKGDVVQLMIFSPFIMALLIFTSIEITTNIEANNINNDVNTLLRQISKAETYQQALTIIDNNVGANKVFKSVEEKNYFKKHMYFYNPTLIGQVVNLGKKYVVGDSTIDFETLWKNGNIVGVTHRRQLIDSTVSSITVTRYTFKLFEDSVEVDRRYMIEGSKTFNEEMI